MSVAIPRKFYQPLLIAGALAFVYFTVLEKLGRDWWHDENYSHGLLIPFVIGYILWQERKRFQATQTRPAAWFGAIGVTISLVALWAGTAGTFPPAHLAGSNAGQRGDLLLGLSTVAFGLRASVAISPGHPNSPDCF